VRPGDEVRLVSAWDGMAPDAEGVLLGWYARDERMALVRFWDGGPLQVRADLLVAVVRCAPRNG